MVKSPCYLCEENEERKEKGLMQRSYLCHSKCSCYKEYKEKLKEVNDKRRKNSLKAADFVESVKRFSGITVTNMNSTRKDNIYA